MSQPFAFVSGSTPAGDPRRTPLQHAIESSRPTFARTARRGGAAAARMVRTPLRRTTPSPREEGESKDVSSEAAAAAAFLAGVAAGANRRKASSPSEPSPSEVSSTAEQKPAAAWLAYAQCEAAAGNMTAARQSFARAVAASPGDRGPWMDWARCEARVADYAAVNSVLREATTAVPEDPDLWHFWAQQTLRPRRTPLVDAQKRARGILVQGIEHCSTSAPLRAELAKLETKARNFDEARRLYSEAVAVDPTDSRTCMDWANLEMRCGRRDAVRAVFSDGVKQVSRRDATVLYTAFARFEAREGNPDTARRLYHQGAEANPRDTYIWQTWACFEEDCGNIDRARELFECGVVVTGGQVATVWQAWGMLEQRAGRPDVARQLFERGTRANPADAATWAAWGRLEATNGNPVEARRLFEHAVEQMDSRTPAGPLFLSWAQLEADGGNFDRACEVLRRAVDRRNDNRADAVRLLHTWAGIEWRAGRKDAAKATYERALRVNPRDPKTAHALARLKIETADYTGARDILCRSRREAPTDPYIITTLALLEWQHFASDGGMERARKLFANGAKHNPRDAKLIKAWATFEAAQGDIQLANRLRAIPRKWSRH